MSSDNTRPLSGTPQSSWADSLLPPFLRRTKSPIRAEITERRRSRRVQQNLSQVPRANRIRPLLWEIVTFLRSHSSSNNPSRTICRILKDNGRRAGIAELKRGLIEEQEYEAARAESMAEAAASAPTGTAMLPTREAQEILSQVLDFAEGVIDQAEEQFEQSLNRRFLDIKVEQVEARALALLAGIRRGYPGIVDELEAGGLILLQQSPKDIEAVRALLLQEASSERRNTTAVLRRLLDANIAARDLARRCAEEGIDLEALSQTLRTLEINLIEMANIRGDMDFSFNSSIHPISIDDRDYASMCFSVILRAELNKLLELQRSSGAAATAA